MLLRLLQAGAVYGGYKAGQSLGTSIGMRRFRKSLESQYNQEFVEQIVSLVQRTKNYEQVPAMIYDLKKKTIYQNLFSMYGEKIADAVLNKMEKSARLGVDYDYDAIASERAKEIGMDVPSDSVSQIYNKYIGRTEAGKLSYDGVAGKTDPNTNTKGNFLKVILWLVAIIVIWNIAVSALNALIPL